MVMDGALIGSSELCDVAVRDPIRSLTMTNGDIMMYDINLILLKLKMRVVWCFY